MANSCSLSLLAPTSRRPLVLISFPRTTRKGNAETATRTLTRLIIHKPLPQRGYLAPEASVERGLYTPGEPPTPAAARCCFATKGKGMTTIYGRGPRSCVGAHSGQTRRLGAAVTYHPARRRQGVGRSRWPKRLSTLLEVAPPPSSQTQTTLHSRYSSEANATVPRLMTSSCKP